VKHADVCVDALLAAREETSRQQFARLVNAALTTAARAEICTYGDLADPDVDVDVDGGCGGGDGDNGNGSVGETDKDGVNVNDDGDVVSKGVKTPAKEKEKLPLRGVCARLLSTLLGVMHTELPKHWLRIEQFFNVFATFAHASAKHAHLLLRMHTLTVFGDFFLAAISPFCRSEAARKTFKNTAKTRGVAVGVGGVVGGATAFVTFSCVFHSLLTHISRSICNSAHFSVLCLGVKSTPVSAWPLRYVVQV
jgi:hypothetical protein